MAYVCKYCGAKSSSPSIAGSPCGSSPTKRHEIIDGNKADFVCRYCGAKSSSSTIAGSPCGSSPTKRHILMD